MSENNICKTCGGYIRPVIAAHSADAETKRMHLAQEIIVLAKKGIAFSDNATESDIPFYLQGALDDIIKLCQEQLKGS